MERWVFAWVGGAGVSGGSQLSATSCGALTSLGSVWSLLRRKTFSPCTSPALMNLRATSSKERLVLAYISAASSGEWVNRWSPCAVCTESFCSAVCLACAIG